MKTVNEVAEYFKVSERTVWNWIASGALNVFQIGKVVRVTDEELERFKKEGKPNERLR